MKKLIFAALAAAVMTVCCFADSVTDELYEQLDIDGLIQAIPQQAADAAEQLGLEDFSPGELLTLSPGEFFGLIKREIFDAVSQYKRELLSVISAVLLAAILSVLGQESQTAGVFRLICVLTVTAILGRPVTQCMLRGCETVSSAAVFMLSYIPVYASAAAANQAAMSAMAYQTLVMAAAQVISQLSAMVFLPLLQSYMLLVIAASVSGSKGIASLLGTVKKVINWGLVFVTTAFSGLLSIQSIFGAAADGAAAKTAKFLVGSFVPVVGSALSDALMVMQSSLRVIKAGIGGFGIIVAVLTFLPVLASVLALRAVVWLAEISAQLLPSGEISGALSGFSNLLSILMALLLSVMMLLVISTAIMFSLGGAAAL